MPACRAILLFHTFGQVPTLARAEPKSKTEAREMVRKAQDILRSLKERTGLTAQQQDWLNSIESALREMETDSASIRLHGVF